MEKTRRICLEEKLSLMRPEPRLCGLVPTSAHRFGCGLEELLAPLGAATVLVLSPSGCQRRDMWTKKAPRRGVTRAEASVGSQWEILDV